uniref:Regulatory protein, ArsR n=1 Tax=mine drainage metagenome TaxID=410659 RepID=E6Q3B0_9ZZZZ
MLRNFKADLFKTLAHPARIRLLDALREGEKTVVELQQALDLGQPSVSQHLAALRGKGLVIARREGLFVRYSVADPRLWDLLDAARDFSDRLLREQRANFEAQS